MCACVCVFSDHIYIYKYKFVVHCRRIGFLIRDIARYYLRTHASCILNSFRSRIPVEIVNMSICFAHPGSAREIPGYVTREFIASHRGTSCRTYAVSLSTTSHNRIGTRVREREIVEIRFSCRHCAARDNKAVRRNEKEKNETDYLSIDFTTYGIEVTIKHDEFTIRHSSSTWRTSAKFVRIYSSSPASAKTPNEIRRRRDSVCVCTMNDTKWTPFHFDWQSACENRTFRPRRPSG